MRPSWTARSSHEARALVDTHSQQVPGRHVIAGIVPSAEEGLQNQLGVEHSKIGRVLVSSAEVQGRVGAPHRTQHRVPHLLPVVREAQVPHGVAVRRLVGEEPRDPECHSASADVGAPDLVHDVTGVPVAVVVSGGVGEGRAGRDGQPQETSVGHVLLEEPAVLARQRHFGESPDGVKHAQLVAPRRSLVVLPGRCLAREGDGGLEVLVDPHPKLHGCVGVVLCVLDGQNCVYLRLERRDVGHAVTDGRRLVQEPDGRGQGSGRRSPRVSHPVQAAKPQQAWKGMPGSCKGQKGYEADRRSVHLSP